MLAVMTMNSSGLFDTNPGGDTVVALGINGTGLMTGINNDTDDQNPNNHRLTAGVIFPLNDTPTFPDITGTWSMTMLEQEIWDGGGGGNDSLNIKLSYGDVVINADHTGSTDFSGINALTGAIVNTGGDFMIYGPVNECYYTDKTTTPFDPSDTASCPGYTTIDGQGGILIPVFLINSIDADNCSAYPGNECPFPMLRVGLDEAKRALAIWSSRDYDGTIYNAPDSCSGAACGNPSDFSLFGVGIKIQ
jgi:hypothetical protein